MTIIITIVAILLIIVGVIYGSLFVLVELMGFMNDVPTPIADWGFTDYLAAAVPLALIVLGVGLLSWWF